MRFVLASASPTRLRVLREAGFDPEVIVSGVDEDITGTAEQQVRELAMVKANEVAGRLADDALVLGCDSLVVHDGEILSKPASPDEAVAWWRRYRGSDATVWTAQYLRRNGQGFLSFGSATVRFAEVLDGEIEGYVATGEPFGVAGGFRLDGRAAAFIESIEGDPGIVHGVSVCQLVTALREFDVEVTDLWV